MKKLLTKWAVAGDGDCMLKLSRIYRDEGNISAADEWLKKSAATENFFAMKELAAQFREDGNPEAVDLYKKLVELGDVEAMEALVDLRGNDAETLKFVLEAIDSAYNEIYVRNYSVIQRTMELGTRRHNECTIQTLHAVERRRIASRIRKLLATEED